MVALPELVISGTVLPITLDQRTTNEDLAGGGAVDAVVPDGATAHDRQTEQRDTFTADSGATPRIPRRFAVAVAGEVLAKLLCPLRLHRRDDPAPQSSGLHELAGGDPLRQRLGQRRAIADGELRTVRALVFASRAVTHSEVTE